MQSNSLLRRVFKEDADKTLEVLSKNSAPKKAVVSILTHLKKELDQPIPIETEGWALKAAHNEGKKSIICTLLALLDQQ